MIVGTLHAGHRSEAAEKAGQFTEAALMGSMPMHVPDFKNVVMPALVAALDEWKAEADKSESAGRFRNGCQIELLDSAWQM